MLFLKNFRLLLVMMVVLILLSACSSTTEVKSETGKTQPIYVVQTSPANMIQMLRSREIDAFVAWEPFNSQAVREGSGRYLMQSAEIWPGHPCCILALSGQNTDENLALALVWANVKANRFIHDPANTEKVLNYAMEYTGKDRDTVIAGMSHVKYVDFPDAKQFQVYFKGLQERNLLKKSPNELGYPDEGAFFVDFLTNKYVELVKAHLAVDPNWMPPQVSAAQKVTLGSLSQDLHEIQGFIAEREGYYRQAGLVSGKNLEMKQYTNGVAVMEAFKNKELVASYLGGAPATLKRINDDIRIRAIAGSNDEGSAIVVSKELPINSIEQLAGKTIAIPAVGTVQYFILDMAARKASRILQVK